MCLPCPTLRLTLLHRVLLANDTCLSSYKGMAHTSAATTTRNITPQATGFSQVHSRGGGEGGGQAMSVLLSWHEKVQPRSSCPVHPAAAVIFPMLFALFTTLSYCVNAKSYHVFLICS